MEKTPKFIHDAIWNECHTIYQKLGPAHSELVYQKALEIELHHLGASSVETEKSVPVFFTDTQGITHTVSSMRVDLLARFVDYVVPIEVKAQQGSIRSGIEYEQVDKYIEGLKAMNVHPTFSMLVNFCTIKETGLQIRAKGQAGAWPPPPGAKSRHSPRSPSVRIVSRHPTLSKNETSICGKE